MKFPFRRASAAAAPAPAAASVDASTVAQRFNFDWAISQDEFTEADTYWWWCVSVRVDPNEVWAEDEEGDLWVVPFTTDGADQVTFGTPVRSRLTAVPVAAADGAFATAAVNRRRQRLLAAFTDRPEKPGRTTQAAATADEPDNERTPMDPAVLQVLARQHGLDPETATEEQINAAVIAADPAAEQPEAEEAEVESPEAAAPTVEQMPVAAAESDDGIRAALGLPASATAEQVRQRISEIEANAQAGADAHAAATAQARDQLVQAAVQDGRIPPSARDAWRTALDARPQEEAAALAALTPGRIPVNERGTSATATSAADNPSLRRALASIPNRKA